jgi:molecular chaperone GrpE
MKDDNNQADNQNDQNANVPSEETATPRYTDQDSNSDTQDDIVIDEEIDEEGEELSPQDKIKKLRTQLKTAVADKQKYLDGWQREKAEFVNARKRDEESKQDFIKFAEVSVIEELIPVLDSCREALKHGEQSTDAQTSEWLKGIKSIHSKLLAACQKRGLEEYGEVGDNFDPNIHQSVSSVPTDKKELDETIAVVLQKGYRMRGKIIRPSLVSVYQV